MDGIIRGVLPRDLSQACSDAIYTATKRGMGVDEACCVVVGIAADYARDRYGDDYLENLAEVVRHRREFPLSEVSK